MVGYGFGAYFVREIGASRGFSWLWSRSILKTQREAVTWGWKGAGEEQKSQLGCCDLNAQAAEMQGWVPRLVWEESRSPFWERENSCMCSWKASQSPWCPKLLPCHCQSSVSGSYLCSLARCPENCWSCLCCFQRTSRPMTSYGPVNHCSHAMFSFKTILSFTAPFPISKGVQVWNRCAIRNMV